jgi:hypothetical protein
LLEADDPFEEEDDPVEDDKAFAGLPLDKLEPVGDALLDALPTWLFCEVNEDEELLLDADDSGVFCVVEEFAPEEALSVVTELAADVFLPEVEAAAPELAVLADP